MKKLSHFCSVILVIAIPVMILILSSNLVLRISATYDYHFNDSQVMNDISYSVTGSEISSAISSYWMPLDRSDFQVYEINGKYKDPVFDSSEQKVMHKAKNIMNILFLAGVAAFLLVVVTYGFFVRQKLRDVLRVRYRIGFGLTLGVLIAQLVCFNIKGFRLWLYQTCIGVKLAKDSTLSVLLGDPFYKTYLIFATVLALVMIGLFTYLNRKFTKPIRIFY